MAASHPRSGRRRRGWLWLPAVPVTLGVVLFGLNGLLVEPLTERGGPAPVPGTTTAARRAEPNSRPTDEPPAWPEVRLEGRAAKERVLETLLAVQERLDRVEDYTATFRKQERIKEKLGPMETMEIKIHQHPFAIYCKSVAPKPGREVVFAEGRHDNKVIAHSSGIAGLLVPRLAVAPDHPLALAESRHPITEAGLAHLIAKLVRSRRMDLDDAESTTCLDRTTDDQGRAWLRAVHVHAHSSPARPFARSEVLYDPETRFPLQIICYDWPQPGHEGKPLVAEHYIYENLDLDAPLTALDFDPANPRYAFRRY